MSARLPEHLELITSAPNGIQKLRGLILELAVRGKLVPQDANDELASKLLKRIAKERARLVAKGKIRKDKRLAVVRDEEKRFDLPKGWEWTPFDSVFSLEYGDNLPAPNRTLTPLVIFWAFTGL